MLNRNFTRRLTPWLTFYLLVVSIGLPLQRVYCACIGEASLTLPGTEHECRAHAPQISEHDHHRTACCLITIDCQHPDTADHNCGSTEVVVAALDADFLLGTVGDFADVALVGISLNVAVWRPLAAHLLAKTLPIRGPAPPGRLAGRQLLVAHQTFLI